MGEDPVEDREKLRGKKAEIGDDLETAEAKSGSVDERAPQPHTGDDVDIAPAPAAGVGPGQPVSPLEDVGEGEQILELERKAQRTPRRPG